MTSKIDNSYIDIKIKLRIDNLPQKNDLLVLDAYSGEGRIWNAIKEKTEKTITTIRLDKKQIPGVIQIDNKDYLKNNDLSKFDIIDLDAYGTCYKQLEIILKKNYKGIIFVTIIDLLVKKHINQIKLLLSNNGIKNIKYYTINKKFYGVINSNISG